MTPRFIKLSGITLVIIATLITATAVFLPYLLDVNAYRIEIINALQSSLNRPVSFKSGSFAWHFGPSFDFKEFVVKEPDGKADFVTAGKISVQVAIIPLLEKRVELKSLTIDNTTISLKRMPDGKLNFDDLLKTGNSDVTVKFKKIRVHNGTVVWNDQIYGIANPLNATINRINMSADHLVRGRKSHVKISAQMANKNGGSTGFSLSGSFKLADSGKPLTDSTADLSLSLKGAEISRFWSYFGKFIPFADCGGNLNIETSLKGTLNDFSSKGRISIADAVVNWPKVFHGPVSPKKLQIDYSGTMNNKSIDLPSVELAVEGFKIKGNFKIADYRSKDPYLSAKASTPGKFRYEDVRNLVPYGIIDRDTTDYIENKIKTGLFKLDTGILEGRISQIAHMEIGNNCNTLYIRGPVEKAVLSYGPKAPTFNNLKGDIELKGKNFNLIGMTGNFGTAPFSLEGSITEYNTDKPADYPIKMTISPNAPEIAWITAIAGLDKLEYSNNSLLNLNGSGHYSAYKLKGDWDLKNATYNLPGYVSKSHGTPHTLTFSTIIRKESTTVTAINYNLTPMIITGSGLIGYGDKPYLGFDLTTNRFPVTESLPILSMWKNYALRGVAQAHIKGGGDPADMSAMDYNGTIDITRFSMLPDESLKPVTGMNGTLIFKGNQLDTTVMPARYGTSAVNIKAAIKSLKSPEGDISVTSQQLNLQDLNLDASGSSKFIKRFNAAGLLKKDAIIINSASGAVNNSNFNIHGIYQTNRTKQSHFTVTSTKLDLDDLRVFASAKKSNKDNNSPGKDMRLTVNADTGNFGKITFNKLTATAQKDNGTIYLHDLSAAILGGKFSAKGRIAPGSSEQGDRYDLTVDIANADAEKLFTALDISKEVTGSLNLHGDLTAVGSSMTDIKKSALGNIKLTMVNGSLKKFSTLSKVFSILNISQLLKFKLPDMVSGGMPYSSIKGSMAVKDGIISTKDLFISSNAINVSIIGSADIVKEELDFTLGAQPLQTVDKIVNRIPIVGWLLTGKDKDLLTAYFEAKGKWSDPQVNAIPVKSMGKGLLNIFIRTFELPVRLFTDTGDVILGK